MLDNNNVSRRRDDEWSTQVFATEGRCGISGDSLLYCSPAAAAIQKSGGCEFAGCTCACAALAKVSGHTNHVVQWMMMIVIITANMSEATDCQTEWMTNCLSVWLTDVRWWFFPIIAVGACWVKAVGTHPPQLMSQISGGICKNKFWISLWVNLDSWNSRLPVVLFRFRFQLQVQFQFCSGPCVCVSFERTHLNLSEPRGESLVHFYLSSSVVHNERLILHGLVSAHGSIFCLLAFANKLWYLPLVPHISFCSFSSTRPTCYLPSLRARARLLAFKFAARN